MLELQNEKWMPNKKPCDFSITGLYIFFRLSQSEAV
jgi:hypothetical protein